VALVRGYRALLRSGDARAQAEALVALLLLSGSARVWQLACLYAVYGTADAFFSPASAALVTETVPRELMQQANALLNLPSSAASVLCPAFAGLMVAALTPGVVIGLDAATFVLSAVALAALQLPPRPRAASRLNVLRELHAGWRELAARTRVWGGIAYFSVANLAIAPLYVLGPFVAEKKLGGAVAWGLIATCGGIGASPVTWRPCVSGRDEHSRPASFSSPSRRSSLHCWPGPFRRP
jgi:MFS family permease